MARFGLRAHLVALVLVVLLPALGVGAAGVWLAVRSYGIAFEARLTDTANALALALDADIETIRDGLAVLATMDEVDPAAEPASRQARLRAGAEVLGVHIALFDTEGRHLARSAASPGDPIPPPARTLETLRRAAEARAPLVSDLVVGAASGRPAAAVLVPVVREERVVAVLGARLDPDRLRALLDAHALGGDGVATLFDGQYRFVARSRAHAEALGRSALPWFIEGTAGRDRGVLTGETTLDGTALIVGFARLSTAPGWIVSVAEPHAAYLRSRAEPLLTLAAAALPLLLLATALALRLARRLLRPIAEIGAHARAVAGGARGSGAAPPAEAASVAEFETLRADIAAAEAALRASEAQLRTIVETVPVGLVLAELPSGRIVGGNSYVEQMLRHPVLHSPDIHSYDEWVSFHADGRRVSGHEYPLARMVLAGEENPSIEVHYQRGDGTRVWTRIMGRPVRDERGAVVGGVVALLDVDAERRAREELAEREARFRALFSSIDEGYCLCEIVTDAAGRPVDHRFLEVNPLFETMTGLKDAVGRTVRELVPDLEPHWSETYGRVALGGETLRFEQGSEAMGRWFDVFATPVEPRGRFALVFKDITERRRAEQALRESEERFRFALEAAGGIGTWDWDVAEDRVKADARFAAMFGVTPEAAAEGVPVSAFVAGIDAGDRDRVAAEIRAAIASAEAGGGGEYSTEYRVRGPDGAVRWLVARGRCYHDGQGRPTRFPGVVVDITARKLAEERQALLAREVDHRAKNALAVVQAALRLTPKEDPSAFARAVEGRVGALARAQTLLAEDRWSGADLHALVRGELEPFLAQADERGPRARYDGPPVALPVGAAQPLAMALHELATNAVKHGALSTPEGCVAVEWQVDAAAGRLRLRWRETGGPELVGPPARRGFGSRVLEGTIRSQLGGRVSVTWQTAGLACELEVPLVQRIHAAPPEAAVAD